MKMTMREGPEREVVVESEMEMGTEAGSIGGRGSGDGDVVRVKRVVE